MDGEEREWARVPSSSVFGCDRLNIINILRQAGIGKGRGGANIDWVVMDELSVGKMGGNRKREKRG